jgi:hypothetical protein
VKEQLTLFAVKVRHGDISQTVQRSENPLSSTGGVM